MSREQTSSYTAEVYLGAIESEKDAKRACAEATAHREACEDRLLQVVGPAVQQMAGMDATARDTVLGLMLPPVAAAVRRLLAQAGLMPTLGEQLSVVSTVDPPASEPTRTRRSFGSDRRPSRPRAGSKTGQIERYYLSCGYVSAARKRGLGTPDTQVTPDGRSRNSVWLTEPERAVCSAAHVPDK